MYNKVKMHLNHRFQYKKRILRTVYGLSSHRTNIFRYEVKDDHNLRKPALCKSFDTVPVGQTRSTYNGDRDTSTLPSCYVILVGCYQRNIQFIPWLLPRGYVLRGSFHSFIMVGKPINPNTSWCRTSTSGELPKCLQFSQFWTHVNIDITSHKMLQYMKSQKV